MFWQKKKDTIQQENSITTETFKNTIADIKLRLDLIEDDIKRLRKKFKIDNRENNYTDKDEKILKSIEDDGFKEIRQLNAQYGKNSKI
jgi:hypothetical protein|tara:strand:- start:885 stop:1148 length:264 start_codon:yes stop_codon:yes gene_type:complete